jgi:hypothetical protein
MYHYDGVTAPHVKYYEIWNEADSTNFWTGTPQQLVAMAAQAYRIIHTDPYAEVIGPSVDASTNWKPWLISYLNAQDPVTGKHGYEVADIASFHAYSGKNAPPENVGNQVVSRRAIYDTNGMSGKPLFQTEGGWGRNIPPDPDMQVAWLSRWYLVQAGLYNADHLLFSNWYTWGLQSSGNSWGQIENPDGTPTTAGLAYGVLTQWLVGSVVSPCNQSGTVWTCGLTRSNGSQALAIWNTAGNSDYRPGSQYTTYLDLSGGTSTINVGEVTIGVKPLLLE